ncbi:anaerobic nitric oxide reductase transcription regulator NorR [Desulfosarcina widdelii]|uniref:Anaerobic nitric oxide reductase transcription regulator NorR n=1 Tax=Desulfosarcina widdelii TaxID=947919 RepID=A0A5K7YXS6_9BACT|nr:nitric oxide reductase transcriptional regulator NorR [Desulfosarcina widdelii]BBO73215.1 anaerobic nitric oxide reductase transcription regulator NorR [Desulfosarcina widdelii]
MDMIEPLVSIAVDLTAAMSAKDRYERLLSAMAKFLPYDAAALMRVDGDLLVPVAARGLIPDAMGRQFARSTHPRLDIICNSDEPVRFPADNTLPDPFDGLLSADAGALSHIHACLGCPLRVNNALIGVLTADAFDPKAFDDMDPRFLKAMGALAGAQMQTANLIDALEKSAERQGQIASDLMQDIHLRQGTQILGGSSVMEHLRREIDLVARSDFTVLVLGETGVGKELVVRAIHAASNRKEAPLLYLNCAALPETLAESEMFGHTRGSFTGASRDRAGKFELANEGTLFLDEIGELPLSVQPKLLRAIQEGEIQRVGSDMTSRVDVRLLAATNRNLEQEVESKRFRADLFHRLNVYPLNVPALRMRKEDIPLLAGHFCERIQRRLGLGPVRINPDSYETMTQYDWPGNVRELENVISRAVLKASFDVTRGDPVVIYPSHLGGDFVSAHLSERPQPPEEKTVFTKDFSFNDAVRALKIRMIQKAIDKNNGNWAAAARDLNMHRSNLHNLAKRLGLKN